MPRRTAGKLIYRYWNSVVPVNPVAIAHAVGVDVRYNRSLGDVCGCFGFRDGRPIIRINPEQPAILQRFAIAHELGHFALKHGRRFFNLFELGKQFVDTPKEFERVQTDFYERQANSFARHLLIPARGVNCMVDDYDLATIEELSEVFAVSESDMEWKIRRMRD